MLGFRFRIAGAVVWALAVVCALEQVQAHCSAVAAFFVRVLCSDSGVRGLIESH